MINKALIKGFRVEPGKKVRLKDWDTGWAQTKELEEAGKEKVKERAKVLLEENLAHLAEMQETLYADDRHALLIVLQAMDAAGKDGTIKHVMSGVNPQGCQVFAFKKPSVEDLDHNFLWRYMRCLPERGRIGIFNRSYYEDEQKKRFLERLERPEKNWKFSINDVGWIGITEWRPLPLATTEGLAPTASGPLQSRVELTPGSLPCTDTSFLSRPSPPFSRWGSAPSAHTASGAC
jgi:polyphosphate kinase 2 (PPK2 family)